jgi:uncharacterized protein (DUF1919 family)
MVVIVNSTSFRMLRRLVLKPFTKVSENCATGSEIKLIEQHYADCFLALLFDPEDAGSTLIRNIRTLLPDCMV